jgi:hypothetical protein
LIGNFPKWVIAGTAILLGGTIVNLAYVLTCKTKIVLQLGCAGILIGIVLISIGECIWLNKQLESVPVHHDVDIHRRYCSVDRSGSHRIARHT